MKLRKLSFSLSEVIAYLEDKITYDLASNNEVAFYEHYVWNNSINKLNTYKSIVEEMKLNYMGA